MLQGRRRKDMMGQREPWAQGGGPEAPGCLERGALLGMPVPDTERLGPDGGGGPGPPAGPGTRSGRGAEGCATRSHPLPWLPAPHSQALQTEEQMPAEPGFWP